MADTTEAERQASEIFDAVRRYLDSQIDVSDAKIRQFEIDAFAKINDRIAALEQARTMRFCGAFDPATHYAIGAVTQRGGSCYVCLVPTNEVPGSSNHWRRLATDR